jgi:hypothetical protein
MATAYTTTYSLAKPEVGASQDTWGALLNGNADSIDDLLDGTTAIAPDLSTLTIGGVDVTSTAAELNILDGVTATAAELNTLDGITATVTELNYSDGVTSNIQTQLDAKQGLDATLTALAGTLTAAGKVPYATDTDTAGELDFVDEDDMASDSATAIPSQQSVKAYVDAGVASASPIVAWCVFNGTGTPAVIAGDNVASITDNGTGDYTINFTNAMADANYAVVLSCSGSNEDPAQNANRIIANVRTTSGGITSKTTSEVRITTVRGATGTLVDVEEIYVQIIGTLA